MPDRRQFLGALSIPVAGAALTRATPALARSWRERIADLARPHDTPAAAAGDEAYWAEVARCYTCDRTIINLNNGGVSPSPACVQEAQKRHLDHANSRPPPFVLWREQEPRVETVRERLASVWGVSPEELAITRNASESLQICQLGIDLQRGDEILCCTQDYPRMLTAFRQRERREGVVLRQVRIPVPAEDPAAIVDAYRAGITPRTRMILASQVINITGQIVPIREIAALARSTNGGIPFIVDGAHAVAHFDFRLPDLDCEYYGASLHKWLGAPHGTGLLYVRRDRIESLWSLMASEEKATSDIRKFEQIGTHPVAASLAIADALDFHLAIGGARKQSRLAYLRDYWVQRLRRSLGDRLRIHTPLRSASPEYPFLSCGLATFQVDGLDSSRLGEHLWERHWILTTPIKHDEFEGVRITPNVYTMLHELDRFCERVEHAAAQGIPA